MSREIRFVGVGLSPSVVRPKQSAAQNRRRRPARHLGRSTHIEQKTTPVTEGHKYDGIFAGATVKPLLETCPLS